MALLLTGTFGVACGSGGSGNPGSGGRGDEGTGGRVTGTGGATGSGGASATGGATGPGGASGTGGATGPGGATATGGRNAAGGASGSGGATACPAVAPQPGGSCAPGLSCYYEDCPGAGRTIASCVSGSSAMPRWSITTGACMTVSCMNAPGMTCPAGQVCLVRTSGVGTFAECVTNTCGTSPLLCGCLQSCSDGCFVVGSAQAGFTIYCNQCPQATCA